MNSLLAKFNPGIEMFETETLFSDAFPSKFKGDGAPIMLIGVFNVSAGICVQPFMAFISTRGTIKVSGGFKAVKADALIL